MSREEVSRLVGDVISDPALLQEAATIQDQAAMERYITAKGYELTREEMVEVWSMTAKVMAGHSAPMADVQASLNTVRTKAMAAQK